MTGAAPRRLSDLEILAAAGSQDPPQFAEGQRVRVFYSVQDPVDGKVVKPTDEQGWVKVEADSEGGSYTFLALAAACVAVEDEAQGT